MSNPTEFKNDSISSSFQQLEVREEIKNDSIGALPEEVILKIFYELNRAELRTCLVVSKPWRVLASQEGVWDALMLREITFGKKQWQKHFGDVGKEPPLPKDIIEILKSPCPFFEGKKVKDTHMLVLIPETVNGKPLNLTTLQELVKAPKEGHATKYEHIWGTIVNDKDVNRATAQSHWALMTRDVIPGSRNKSYRAQRDLINQLAEQTGLNYEVPPVLDATICIFMHHVGSGKRLFNDKPMTYTHCQENIQYQQLQYQQLIVGGFSLAGLTVYNYNFRTTCNLDFGSYAVAALRKFF